MIYKPSPRSILVRIEKRPVAFATGLFYTVGGRHVGDPL